MMMARLLPILTMSVLIVVATAAAGCSRLSARSVPAPPPPLDVPSPPPRVVEAAEAEPKSPGVLVDAPAGGAPSSRRSPPRVEVPKPEPPKPEPTPVPAAEVPTPVEPAKPATLQTAPPEREAVLEQEIRTRLERANKDLGRVDYGRLPPDSKQQYDQAKRFVTQAEEALRAKNLIFARTLADNAANIAAQLVGR